MGYELENKLFELQMVCNRYKAVDQLADWVLYAITSYIHTGRATVAFIRAFNNFPTDRFQDLIRKCLNGDRSDIGIIKTAKRMIMEEA
jgi:hypothetical protein